MRPALRFEDTGNGIAIGGVSRQAIDCLGRNGDKLACSQRLGRLQNCLFIWCYCLGQGRFSDRAHCLHDGQGSPQACADELTV